MQASLAYLKSILRDVPRRAPTFKQSRLGQPDGLPEKVFNIWLIVGQRCGQLRRSVNPHSLKLAKQTLIAADTSAPSNK
jgi:hypothetical protein